MGCIVVITGFLLIFNTSRKLENFDNKNKYVTPDKHISYFDFLFLSKRNQGEFRNRILTMIWGKETGKISHLPGHLVLIFMFFFLFRKCLTIGP